MQAAKIRREKPKFCRVYAVKQAVFLHNAGKKTARAACRGQEIGYYGGWSEAVLPSRGGVFAWRLFAFVDRIFLVKDIRSAQTA